MPPPCYPRRPEAPPRELRTFHSAGGDVVPSRRPHAHCPSAAPSVGKAPVRRRIDRRLSTPSAWSS